MQMKVKMKAIITHPLAWAQLEMSQNNIFRHQRALPATCIVDHIINMAYINILSCWWTRETMSVISDVYNYFFLLFGIIRLVWHFHRKIIRIRETNYIRRARNWVIFCKFGAIMEKQCLKGAITSEAVLGNHFMLPYSKAQMS